MSLYDDVLAAGAPSIQPGQSLTDDLLAQILAYQTNGQFSENPNVGGGDFWEAPGAVGNEGFRLYDIPTLAYMGNGDSTTPVERGSQRYITRVRPNTGGRIGDWWNLDKTYGGQFDVNSPSAEFNTSAAMIAASYLGGNALNQAYGTGGASGGFGAAGVGGTEAAGNLALDQAMIDMGAGATNVGAGEVAATTGLGDAATQTIEVVGSKIPPATLPAEALAIPPLAEPALQELGTIPEADPGLDPTNYSNEGRNYPDPQSTQGPGGSPINASMDPTRVLPDNSSTTVVPPGNSGGGPPVNLDPSKINDWASLFNVLSGLYGMKLAGDVAEKSDPFGPYRKGYADRLMALEANPGLLKSTPGFLAGQDAIKRQMAAKGYLGSGNMAGALMRYSGDSYQNEANRLATLAGANINPGQTYFNQAQLVGQSLSNIGYGLSPYMAGGPR